MTLQQKTEARRFITLIDALYEYKVKVIISAQAPPRNLFVGQYESKDKVDNSGPNIDWEHASLFTGEVLLYS